MGGKPKAEKSIDLSGLPRIGNYDRIDWYNSIGYILSFKYEDMIGEIEIIDVYSKHVGKNNKKTTILKVKSNNKISEIETYHLTKCCICNIIDDSYNKEFLKKIAETKYKYEVNTRLKNAKRDLVITDRLVRYVEKYKEVYRFYKYICNDCGVESESNEQSLTSGSGCPVCVGKTVIEGVNDIPTTAPWMVKYFQGGHDEAKLYTKYSSKYIYPICPDCLTIKKEKVKIANICKNKILVCSCGINVSYPEKFMVNILNQMDVKYIWRYCPKWAVDRTGSQRQYDFYLPNHEIIIEMDGGFHKKSHPKSQITLKEIVEIDFWKDEMAFNQNIKLIRVESYKSELEYLKSNVLRKLSFYFNLDAIDWIKASEYATSNTVKEVCEDFRLNNLTLNQLSEKYKLRKETISRYLRTGTIYGWCIYTFKSKKIRPVDVYNMADEFIKTYPSISALSKSSIDDLGVFLSISGIRSIVDGVRKHIKGFIIKASEQ